jgi:hypothetical protein
MEEKISDSEKIKVKPQNIDKVIFTQGNSSLLGDIDEKKIDFIKERIKEFFNMKNINFLFGSGTSSGAIPNMGGLYIKVVEELKKDENEKLKIKFESIQNKIEKQDDLENILGILYSYRVYLKDKNKDPRNSICSKLIELIEKIVFDEINILEVDLISSNEFKNYQRFYQKIALRNKDLSRINIFTTNNDLFNEYALDSINIHYINGFSGGVNKYFNPALFNYNYSKRMDTSIEKFEPVENMVYLYKIHGSVNWLEDSSNANSFFNIKEVSKPERKPGIENVLIYPTPTKQNKSLGSPYVEMFREFQKKLLEPHTVLFIMGYSFSDEHVNNIIYQALATNSTINVVVFGELDSKITTINDNRIFNIYGKSNGDKIHYFDFIVNTLLPNIDAFKSHDNILNEFLKSIKKID